MDSDSGFGCAIFGEHTGDGALGNRITVTRPVTVVTWKGKVLGNQVGGSGAWLLQAFWNYGAIRVVLKLTEL